MNAPDVFARYLDLAPLAGRSAGRVRCIFHEERTPSLSVDLARGLFHCFGCGAQGGVRAFLRRVGEDVGPPPPRRAPSAFEEVVELARSQPWNRPGVLDSYRRADEARGQRRLADECRRYAAAHPMDDETRWALLADAARYDTEACRVED